MAEKYWYGGARAGAWDYDTSVNDTLDAGTTETIDNAAAVDKGGGEVGIPITGHSFAADESVIIDGTTNYDGTHTIQSQTANEIVIAATYVAETFGGTETAEENGAIDKGDGTVGIPITGHAFEADDQVTIASTTNYNGTHTIESVSTNEIVITATHVAETFAGTETVTAVSNWKLVSSGADTAKPAAADIVYFNGRAADDSTTGKKQSADVNIDATGTGTPDLGGLFVTPEFTGDIGTSSEYLEVEADGNMILIEGTGTYYIKLSAGTGTDADCGQCVINNAAATVYLASLENDGSNVALWALIVGFSGTLYIDDDTAVTELRVATKSMTVYGGSGIENAKTSTNATVTMVNGKCYWNSDAIGPSLYGGNFYWGTSGMTAIASAVLSKLIIYSGANFYWQMAATSQSTINQFIAYGGLINAAGSVNAEYSKVIGDGASNSQLWGSAKVNLNNSNQNISVTAGSDIECHGGILTPPPGAAIDW